MHLDVIGDKAELLSLGATMVRDPPHCLAADPRPAHWAAVHAALDDPRYVAILLGSLREAGAHQQTAALLARNPAAHVALDNPASMPNSVAALLNRLWLVGAPEQAAALAGRLPAAGMFGLFLQQNGPADQFRFGREADGTSVAPWGWEDLDLWLILARRDKRHRRSN